MTASTLRVESHIAARAKKLHSFLWFVVEIRPIGASRKQVFVFIDPTTRTACIAELGDDVPAIKVKDVCHLCCNPVQTLTIAHSLEHWNLNVIHESSPMLVRIAKPSKALLDVSEKPNAASGIFSDMPLIPPSILLLRSNRALMAWCIADAIRIHRRVAIPSHPSERVKRTLSGNRHKGASVMGANSNDCHAIPTLSIWPLRVVGVVDSYAVVKGFVHDSFHTLFRYLSYITNHELHTIFRRAQKIPDRSRGQSLEVEKFRYAGSDQTGITNEPRGYCLWKIRRLVLPAHKTWGKLRVLGSAFVLMLPVISAPLNRLGSLASTARVPMSLDPRITSLPTVRSRRMR